PTITHHSDALPGCVTWAHRDAPLQYPTITRRPDRPSPDGRMAVTYGTDIHLHHPITPKHFSLIT
ncbi:MAG: hypothetical protein ACK5GU_08760, partial [Chloroflexota bacterium]